MLKYKVEKINATYLRGGTSKGVFFKLNELPERAQNHGKERDALLLRVIGSPDPYGKHTDGMGGGTSSTSKVVILSKSKRDGHDVDYLFGQVSIQDALIDWSGNCGNLTAAVGPFAITNGLIDVARIPSSGMLEIKIWQANIGKTILARVPIENHQVQEMGDFHLDGVAFPAAEIELDFINPADTSNAVLPTGHPKESLQIPNLGDVEVSLVNAGIPTIFIRASRLGLLGSELQERINQDSVLLEMLESIRAHGAVKMGLIKQLSEAKTQQHTPKLVMLAQANTYTASSGTIVPEDAFDLLTRAMSMGKLHHAMMGTAAVAIGAAAAIEGTLVAEIIGRSVNKVTFGHPSGTLMVGATVNKSGGHWSVDKVTMSRSARVLMEGKVSVPITVY